MLQLTLLRPSGGGVVSVLRYPFRIGRGTGDQMRLQVPGVWERHCTLEWRGLEGIHLVAHPEASTTLNGKPVKLARVKNGDIVDLGGVRLMLSVRPVAQRNFATLEVAFWAVLMGIGIIQIFLMLRGLP